MGTVLSCAQVRQERPAACALVRVLARIASWSLKTNTVEQCAHACKGAASHLHLAMQRWQVGISAHDQGMHQLAGVDINQVDAHLQTHSTAQNALSAAAGCRRIAAIHVDYWAAPLARHQLLHERNAG